MTKAPWVVALVFTVACGGSDKQPVDPGNKGGGPIDPTPVEQAKTTALVVAPFTLTITGTRRDGSKQVQVVRGTSDGVISMQRDGGETREVVRVSSDGAFTPLVESRVDVARLSADGVFTIGEQSIPGKVGDDGTIYGPDGKPLLKIEGGKVIGLAEGVMSSKVTSNGQVISETSFEMTVEGGDEIRRLVGAILLLQMSGARGESESEAKPAPPPTIP